MPDLPPILVGFTFVAFEATAFFGAAAFFFAAAFFIFAIRFVLEYLINK